MIGVHQNPRPRPFLLTYVLTLKSARKAGGMRLGFIKCSICWGSNRWSVNYERHDLTLLVLLEPKLNRTIRSVNPSQHLRAEDAGIGAQRLHLGGQIRQLALGFV